MITNPCSMSSYLDRFLILLPQLIYVHSLEQPISVASLVQQDIHVGLLVQQFVRTGFIVRHLIHEGYRKTANTHRLSCMTANPQIHFYN